MASKSNRPPADLDPAAPLTDEEIGTLRPARALFAEKGIALPKVLGRPKKEDPKVQLSIRLERQVVEHFKSGGPGWQTRMGEVLSREAARSTGSTTPPKEAENDRSPTRRKAGRNPA